MNESEQWTRPDNERMQQMAEIALCLCSCVVLSYSGARIECDDNRLLAIRLQWSSKQAILLIIIFLRLRMRSRCRFKAHRMSVEGSVRDHPYMYMSIDYRYSYSNIYRY